MTVYALDDERTIRAGRRARDWMKSGLLNAAQYDRLKPELQVDLRRTNPFLRLTLFVFTMLILQAGLGLIGIFVLALFDTRTDQAAKWAMLCALGGVFSFWLAGFLVTRCRLYRFGIEEAAAVAAVVLMAVAAGLGSSEISHNSDAAMAAALVAGGAVALAVFFRFGYLYAALAAAACVVALPFVLSDSETIQRMIALAILTAIAAAGWIKRTEYGDEHPGDTYGLIEAAAWTGIYFVVTLDVFDDLGRSSWSYWPTYAGIWIVPLSGLWVSIRSKHRMLLDVSLIMLLMTLLLNKEYLGIAPNPWDSCVLGLMLMGGAIALKRWLAAGENGQRYGFTAARILASDKSTVAVFGTVASLAHPGTPEAQPAAAPDPIGGGGRSGGAGSSGSF